MDEPVQERPLRRALWRRERVLSSRLLGDFTHAVGAFMITLIKVYAEKPVDAVTVTRDKTVRLRTQPIADDRKTKNRP
jgi:hypothetical protein